jgi:nucleobase:cation symporter-1, NCS1 family
MAVRTIPQQRPTRPPAVEAPLALTTDVPRTLGWVDQTTMWGSFGISLFGPVSGALIVATTGDLTSALLALLVGCALGGIILGSAAVFGSVTGAPAMVTMRGIFGRRGSVFPTVINIAQNVGWATMEITLISTAASQAMGGQSRRWIYVLVAGAVATTMAIRPLGSVRLIRKIMVWLVLAATAYLFYQVFQHPLGDIPGNGVVGFWPAVDLGIAGIVSFAPLAADYSRHSKSNGAAFGSAAIGYGGAALIYYALGVFAVAALATNSTNVVTALVALPAGALMLGILAVDEVDEAFANIYSTTMSAHNLTPKVDRRVISAAIGVVATSLAIVIDINSYADFLYLIGSVFVPLFAAAAVDFFVVCRMRWDVSDQARFRWPPVVAWLGGFVAYQLVYPGTLRGWGGFWYDMQGWLHITPPTWLGSSIASIVVAACLAIVLGLAAAGRRTDVSP